MASGKFAEQLTRLAAAQVCVDVGFKSVSRLPLLILCPPGDVLRGACPSPSPRVHTMKCSCERSRGQLCTAMQLRTTGPPAFWHQPSTDELRLRSHSSTVHLKGIPLGLPSHPPALTRSIDPPLFVLFTRHSRPSLVCRPTLRRLTRCRTWWSDTWRKWGGWRPTTPTTVSHHLSYICEAIAGVPRDGQTSSSTRSSSDTTPPGVACVPLMLPCQGTTTLGHHL